MARPVISIVSGFLLIILLAINSSCNNGLNKLVLIVNGDKSPEIDLQVDNEIWSFRLDTGGLALYLNMNHLDSIPKNRWVDQMDYRFWSSSFRAWRVIGTRISIPGSGYVGEVPHHNALLIEEHSEFHDECGDRYRCGGIVGAEALGVIAKRIHHREPGNLSIVSGKCQNWWIRQSPMPVVKGRDREGKELTLLIDSGMFKSKLFVVGENDFFDIHVPGISNPIQATGISEAKMNGSFSNVTLNGIRFDGAIGWDDLRQTQWTWVPCTGAFRFDGYINNDSLSGED